MVYEWILVIIVFVNGSAVVYHPTEEDKIKTIHTNVDSCYNERERVVFNRKRPIVNYQVICVQKDENL